MYRGAYGHGEARGGRKKRDLNILFTTPPPPQSPSPPMVQTWWFVLWLVCGTCVVCTVCGGGGGIVHTVCTVYVVCSIHNKVSLMYCTVHVRDYLKGVCQEICPLIL